MVWSRLSDTLYFFRQHGLSLLWLLVPVLLPTSLFINHRYHVVLGGDVEKAAADGLALGVQFFAGLLANILVMQYTLAAIGNDASGRSAPVWSEALARVPSLFVVQMVAGILIAMGLLLLILPGIWLMGVLMPAYVLVVAEKLPGLEAIRQAWFRFKPAAWQLAAALGVLVVGLLVCMTVLEGVERSLAAQGWPWAWVIGAVLDVVGLLLAQTVMILLVRFYDLEQSAHAQGNGPGA
jgi:hypothetical protein